MNVYLYVFTLYRVTQKKEGKWQANPPGVARKIKGYIDIIATHPFFKEIY
jgi:hypothetical protein